MHVTYMRYIYEIYMLHICFIYVAYIKYREKSHFSICIYVTYINLTYIYNIFIYNAYIKYREKSHFPICTYMQHTYFTYMTTYMSPYIFFICRIYQLFHMGLFQSCPILTFLMFLSRSSSISRQRQEPISSLDSERWADFLC